jgi:hypothetical protein
MSSAQKVSSANRLSVNRLSVNSLTMAGLANIPLSGDPDVNSLLATEEGRELLSYIVRCALAEGDALYATVEGVEYVFDGLIGLAPNWHEQAFSADEKGWMSACLLAHVNNFGLVVPISLRGAHPALAVTPEEIAGYTHAEGGFYGDLFREDQVMYACLGWDPQGEPEDQSPFLPERVCAYSSEEIGGLTECGFINVGPCQRACTTSTLTGPNDPLDRAWGDCRSELPDEEGAFREGTENFPHVITVFLPASK